MTIEGFIDIVCHAYRQAYPGVLVTSMDVMSKRRFKEYIECRQVCMYLMRQAGMSYTSIGRTFLKDHATVIHSCHVINGYLQVRASQSRVVAIAAKELLDRGGLVIDVAKPSRCHMKELRQWMAEADKMKAERDIERANVYRLTAELCELKRDNDALRGMLEARDPDDDEDLDRMGMEDGYVTPMEWTPEERKRLNELRKTHIA